jgi:hypothetical protein
MQTHTKKKQKGKPQIGLYNNDLIGRRMWCVVRELSPAPCDAAYASLGSKGLCWPNAWGPAVGVIKCREANHRVQ